MEAFTLSQMITDIGTIVSGCVQWLGTVVTAVVSQPLLLFAALLAFVSLGVHWFRMLSR